MKTLLLLRHGKSSWDDASLSDFDRPLKPRGVEASRRIGKLLRDEELIPGLVLCSTAVRAKETLRLCLEETDVEPTVKYLDEVYHCAPATFSTLLQQTDPVIKVVMIVGHNPGLEEFLTALTGKTKDFPTAALAKIKIQISHWSQFNTETTGRLADLWYPRELKSND